MLSLSMAMSCVQLKRLSPAIRSISNHRHASKTTVDLSLLKTALKQTRDIREFEQIISQMLHLQRCRDFKEFKQILSQTFLTGFIKKTFVAKRLLHFSTNALPSIHLHYSYQIFNVIENPDASIYNIMVMAYVRRDYPHTAIHFYKLMLYKNVGPNVYTYPFLVEACAVRVFKFEGRQMHNHVLKLGFNSDVDVRSTLVDMYADCDVVSDALKVFYEGPMMGSFVWYSLLETFNGYLGVEYTEKIYNMMPEKDTVASCYMVLTYQRDCEYGKAAQLMDEIRDDDTVFWSKLIYLYQEVVFGEKYEEALDLFMDIHTNGITIDELVVDAVLLCCINITGLKDTEIVMGRLVHCIIVKIGIESDVELQNRLICMYSGYGEILSAQNLFNAACWLDVSSWEYMFVGYMACGLVDNAKALIEYMPQDDIVSRTKMMRYYSHHGCFAESLALFHEMVRSGIIPHEDTMYSAIKLLACSFSAPDIGKCIHAYLIKHGYSLMDRDRLWDALSRMYEGGSKGERGFH